MLSFLRQRVYDKNQHFYRLSKTMKLQNKDSLLSSAFNISMLDVYYLDYFPSIVNFEQILLINFFTFILLMLFGLIPARKAANTNPIKIINHA